MSTPLTENGHVVKKKKGPRISASARAGLVFPVGRAHRTLRKSFKGRVSKAASVYLASVLEYLSCEILELAGDSAKGDDLKRIQGRHIKAGVNDDEELKLLLEKVSFDVRNGPQATKKKKKRGADGPQERAVKAKPVAKKKKFEKKEKETHT